MIFQLKFFYRVSFQDENEWVTDLAVLSFTVSLPFLWVLFPLMELLIYETNYWKVLGTFFRSMFRLQCYSQPSSTFTFLLVDSGKFLFLKCFHSINTKKILSTIVVRKLQSLILLVTRRLAQLEPCIVPSVPISPQNPRVVWSIMSIRNTVLPNLLSICTALNDWKEKLRKFSNTPFVKCMDWAQINSKESAWTIFLLLRIC